MIFSVAGVSSAEAKAERSSSMDGEVVRRNPVLVTIERQTSDPCGVSPFFHTGFYLQPGRYLDKDAFNDESITADCSNISAD